METGRPPADLQHTYPEIEAVPAADLGQTFPEIAAARALPLVDGRYVVERELGRGTFGLVFLARDIWLERRACVKVIAPEHLTDELVRRRFRREAVSAASVRSDHVAQVYGFGPHADGYFLAMEHVPGPDLQYLVDEHERHGARIPLLRAVSILRQVCDGVAAIHRAGVIHRDIKPGNVVVEEATGRPVLIDFGLALPGPGDRPRLSSAALVIGTPEYMAPEMVDPTGLGPVSAATDIYALGCMAFELLTGKPPFHDAGPIDLLRMQIEATPPRPSDRVAELAPFDAPLLAALAKSPRERITSADELGHALDQAGRRVLPPVLPERSEGGLDLPSGLHRFVVPEMPASPQGALAPADVVSGSRRVLVVDADAELRALAASAVQLAFYGTDVRIKAVKSGASAVRDVGEKAPDLILLDYDMPDLDGIETLARIRDQPKGRTARVVVLSSKLRSEILWRFEVLGIDAFVAKPVELPALVDTIAGLATRAGWLRPTDG